jgi:hypothetical protein
MSMKLSKMARQIKAVGVAIEANKLREEEIKANNAELLKGFALKVMEQAGLNCDINSVHVNQDSILSELRNKLLNSANYEKLKGDYNLLSVRLDQCESALAGPPRDEAEL